jgi:hypothetical protein
VDLNEEEILLSAKQSDEEVEGEEDGNQDAEVGNSDNDQ